MVKFNNYKKVDVYIFAVVISKKVSGMRNLDLSLPKEAAYLLDLLKKNIEVGFG